MDRTARLLMVAGTLLSATSLPAQQQPRIDGGPYARMVVHSPHDGQRDEFEAGYRRHLEWHRAKQDPWTWYGWFVVMGARTGKFVDGTFGHDAADFDRPVDPAGDAADNARNVHPYADVAEHVVLERLDSLSSGLPAPDTTRFLLLTTYDVGPGQAAGFEALVARRARALRDPPAGASTADRPRYTWYRIALGGPEPRYLLLRPAAQPSAAVRMASWFGPGTDESRLDATRIVSSVSSELLQYRPDLSYLP